MAVESLRRCALFAHVSDDGLRAIAGQMRRRRFRRNEVIFHQGDIGDSLLVVASGGVKIVLPSQEGDEAIIASLHPGDFFGELALLDRAPRNATVTADTELDVILLGQREFSALLDTVPTLAHKMLTGLARRIHEVDSKSLN